MDENSVTNPLLTSQAEFGERKFQLKSLAKWVLKVLMWVIFVAWVVVIFLYPAEFFRDVTNKWNDITGKTVFGKSGSYFLLFSGPVLIIAVLAIVQLIVSGEEEFHEKKSLKRPRFRLWTFPVLIDGPLGVVSATEFIGILLCAVYIIWSMYSFTVQNLHFLSLFEKIYHLTSKEKSLLLEEFTGGRLGMVGLFCMAFLFLPISRGSVLLRLIDIPFEHATRYHVWLGHITMVLFTLHGLFYVHAWQVQGRLVEEVLQWKNVGFANLAGVISLLAGILMWVTSLPRVRKFNFELFFYTHQLYVVFVVFLAMHVGPIIFSMGAGGIFLFILDRFLRFCQSRRTVKVISARSLPCGTMELVFSKPRNLRYNALSFIFLQVRELSWLQWHPFSVSSSPLDGNHHLAVLIKVLGKWTDKLNQKILSIQEPQNAPVSSPQVSITASVEGPYGHEVPYHLMYENLILVAGGIGVSPFLAIISDVLHRKREGRPCLPKNILLLWAIKKSDELSILSTLDMESICPSYSNKLNLDIRVYVTRESEPPLEEGKHVVISPSVYPAPNGCPMSVLVGTGDNIWSGMYVIASIVGFVILMGLLQKFHINANGIESWWYQGLLQVLMMVASVMIFGGFVVVFWNIWGGKLPESEKVEPEKNGKVQLQEPVVDDNPSQKSVTNSTTLHYGTRPDLKGIFGNISESWGNVNVGVLMCGPETLQASVARECRSRTMRREHHQPIFHFHSHSFDL